MKKYILLIASLIWAILSIAQGQTYPRIVQRATAGNTVQDARLYTQYNLGIPRYVDTTTANLFLNAGNDSCGTIIFTYDIDAFWIRECSPSKHWGSYKVNTILPDGVYMGGNVYYTGTGLTFGVTAALFVLNGNIYRTNDTTFSLQAADPTFGRSDLIGLTSDNGGQATQITGEPSSNPQEPSYNPQTFIRRAQVSVPAGSLVPGGIVDYLIYNENTGPPGEYTASSTGTVNFDDTQFPYNGTKDAAVTALSNSQNIEFEWTDTVHSGNKGNLILFIRLAAIMPVTKNLNAQLMLAGNPVSSIFNFTGQGMNRFLINQYQPVVFPMNVFGPQNIVFDAVRITSSGTGTLPTFYLDYILFQEGVLPTPTLYRFGLEDNFLTVPREVDFNGTTFRFKNINKFISTVSAISDSAYTIRTTGGVDLFRVNALTNTAHIFQVNAGNGTLTVDAAAARISGAHILQFNLGGYIEAYQESLKILRAYPMSGDRINLLLRNDNLDSAPNDSTLYNPIQANWTSEDNTTRTKWYIRADAAQWVASMPHTATADTFMVWKDGFYQGMTLAEMQALVGGGSVTSVATNTGTGITGGTITTSGTLAIDTTSTISTKANVLSQIAANGTFYNSNIGSGFRLAVPNTNNIKTLFGINGILLDSATNSNAITAQVDSTIYATKAFVASVAGGGGFTGVTSVSGVNTNGFSFSIANPTTTPAITLSTTVTGMLKGNGTAISAATTGTDYSLGTSALATGILKSTTATGALTIAVAGDFPTLNQNTTGTASNVTGTVLVPNGGSGLTSLTAYALMTGGTTSTGNMQQVSGVGTSGQVLTSNGAGILPTWQNAATGVASITGTANQVIASAATGAVTLSLPQSIATTSTPTFRSLTLGGTAATTPLTFTTNTDATAAAGRWYYNTTRLGFSLASTILRVPLTNDVTPSNGQIPIGNGTNYTVAAISPANNSMVITNGSGSITVGLNMAPQTLTDASTITWNAANGFNAIVTLGAAGRTLTITNPVAGATYLIRIIQGAGGNKTITTWPTGTKWPGGTAPTLSTIAGRMDIVSLYCEAAGSFYGASNTNYQ